ncbi:DUF6053 domain-containing protein [Lysobacter sp. TAB13]|uniref:DUF6053 domain-containing protein n=1 Tax=Lysobacter sp. TAB13 TaxID=3233065 RepID=UPI003F943178
MGGASAPMLSAQVAAVGSESLGAAALTQPPPDDLSWPRKRLLRRPRRRIGA